jgi:hypothetical protein
MEVGARRAGRALDFDTFFPDLKTYPMTKQILIEAAAVTQESGYWIIRCLYCRKHFALSTTTLYPEYQTF